MLDPGSRCQCLCFIGESSSAIYFSLTKPELQSPPSTNKQIQSCKPLHDTPRLQERPLSTSEGLQNLKTSLCQPAFLHLSSRRLSAPFETSIYKCCPLRIPQPLIARIRRENNRKHDKGMSLKERKTTNSRDKRVLCVYSDK